MTEKIFDIYINASKVAGFTRFNKFLNDLDLKTHLCQYNIWMENLFQKCDETNKCEENSTFLATGLKNENISLDLFEKINNTKIVARNSQFIKKNILRIESDSQLFIIKIGGRVDGMSISGDVIYETKCRMYRFFNEIKDYEKVQIEIYLWLFDKQKCVFIENFNGEQKSIIYEKDENFFKIIKDDLNNYFQNLINTFKVKAKTLDSLIADNKLLSGLKT